MSGILYGVGVGPGDPELLTLKAARILRECDVIAHPGHDGDSAALEIIRPYLQGKPLLECRFPMTRDPQVLEEAHQLAADTVCHRLDKGETVAFVTLGDPSVYSTYAYLHKRVVARGYAAEMIPGVPSFCAAAARLNQSLCENGEPLHVLPASYPGQADSLKLPGAKVLMKAGRQMPEVLEALREQKLLDKASVVVRCGMEGEVVYRDLSLSHPDTEYFSIVLIKGE